MSLFEGYDVDWFVFDKTDRLVHFASGGGFLPDFIVESHMAIAQEILKLPVVSPKVEFSPILRELVSFSSDKEFNDYSEPFAKYAKRGLFSYDKTELNNHEDPIYHLVAKPILFLSALDVPATIVSSIYKMNDFITENNLQVNTSSFFK